MNDQATPSEAATPAPATDGGKGLGAESCSTLLEWLESECFDLRCVEQRGYDDSDVLWIVYSHHMSEPKLREEGYGRTPAEAIRDAMLPKGDPRRWDYMPEFEDDEPMDDATRYALGSM